ncbi:MAG: hypothetical protein Q4C96_07815 [Planctomycetia bacterium]|nr:hypothetical protein [Planctomycetia bacterium]
MKFTRTSFFLLPLRIIGSMYFAVTLIILLSLIMGWATFVDKDYGSDASMFAIYSSWWFITLFSFLGLSVIASTILRFPWKKYQIGFLVTHLGIIILLAGCSLTLLRGKSAMLGIWEGHHNHIAVSDNSILVLQIFNDNPENSFQKDLANYNSGNFFNADKTYQQVKHSYYIHFEPGPFTWDFYKDAPIFSFSKGDKLPFFPWNMATSDRHHPILFQRNGIQLEILDYRNCAVKKPLASGPEIIFYSKKNPENPEIYELTSQQRHFTGNGVLLFYHEARSEEEVNAFRSCTPDLSEMKENENILLTLFVEGTPFSFSAESLPEGKPRPLEGTSWTVTLRRRDPSFGLMQLDFQNKEGHVVPLNITPHVPGMNQHSAENRIFAWSWARNLPDVSLENLPGSPEIKSMMRRMQMMQKCPQVEITRAPDGTLYGRSWRYPTVEHFTISQETPTQIFGETPLAASLMLSPKTTPDIGNYAIIPSPLKDITQEKKLMGIQAVKVRLTVDGNITERWLCGMQNNRIIPPAPPEPDELLIVRGKNRWVALTLRYEEIMLGFRLHLEQFHRRLDPGTSVAARYSSDVTLLDLQDPQKILQKNIPIIINQPVDFYDPAAKHSWRIYQTSFQGPFLPGSPQFSQFVPPTSPREQLYLSQFNISYDPGRGFLYLGCFLIITGIAIMFYMKAYFFGK